MTLYCTCGEKFNHAHCAYCGQIIGYWDKWCGKNDCKKREQTPNQ